MRARLQAVVRRVLTGAAALALATTMTAGLARAEPPLTVQDAKAQVEQLETEAAAIDQQYVEVKSKVDEGRKKFKAKQGDVKAQAAQVARIRLQVGQVALARFQNRDLDTAAQLFFTEETDEFLSQISTVEKVSQNQNTVLQDYQAEQAQLAELTRSARTDLAALEKQEKELSELSAASDKKIAESKAILAKLTAEERARIAAEERRLLAEARAAAKEKSDDGARKVAGGTDEGSATGTGKGAKAVAFARSQLGKPYGRNGSGPGSYDCSGLTSAAWRSAGVSLPRTSSAQSGVGRSVSRSELQPGDLVFFYSPVSHVGIYSGDGQMIHSPRPGKVVSYSKISYMPFANARRPG